MHAVALILLVLSGLCCAAAGILRWRLLDREEAEPRSSASGFLWLGLLLLTGCLVASLIDGQHLRFLYGAVAAWATVACAVFLAGFLATPTPALLSLPVGGMALLVALLAGLETPAGPLADELSWIKVVHVLFVASFSAALLLAAAAGGLYLIAARQLKAGTPRSLRLPNLPTLARVNEISLIVAVALLLGGVSTGGAAMRLRPEFTVLSPVPVMALLDLLLLTALLAGHSLRRLAARALASASLGMVLMLAATVVVLFVDQAHG
jgi:hypothetical protein